MSEETQQSAHCKCRYYCTKMEEGHEKKTVHKTKRVSRSKEGAKPRRREQKENKTRNVPASKQQPLSQSGR
jgi:hypothetical protein